MLWHSSGSDTIWVWNLSAAFDLNKEVRTLLHKSIIKLRASKIAAKPSLILGQNVMLVNFQENSILK